MQIKEIIKVTRARLISGDPAKEIDLASISTDSRTIRPGEFFLPLEGDNFNGEDFIDDAFKKGAVGAFTTVHSPQSIVHSKTVIRVKDTVAALQALARRQRKKFRIPLIGVTGSNGKTTVKEMIARVLSTKYNVLKNEGTKNNHIGVPLTLLKLKKDHQICVVEMGTNHKGEICLLADIARPNVAVITNIGPSHLKFLKNLKGVFDAKKEIFEFFKKESAAVLNGDDGYLARIKSDKFRVFRFGFGPTNDFRASRVSVEGGRIKFFLNDRAYFILNLLGPHNVYNALAAIAAAHYFDVGYEAIRDALCGYAPPSMRLNVRNLSGLTVIDDAYNSNPLSMSSALESVKDYPAGSRWVVSADMLELGEKENDFHGMVGETIAKLGFDGLLTFGGLSRHTSSRALECGMAKEKVWHCSTREEVAEILRKIAKEGDCILVKGSRAMKMEEVIDKLKPATYN